MLLLSYASATAQQFAGVHGVVETTDGTPIARAHIVLRAVGSRVSAVSGASGTFTLPYAVRGTYDLIASAPGYQVLAEHSVTIARGTTLTLTLSRATTASLTTIGRVRASTGESVGTSSAPSISIAAQSAAASGTTSVASMLSSELSVTPVLPLGGGGNAIASYAIRGPDPTETLVDIDGHQVNNANTGDFDLALIDPAALQSVQVIYGIAPSSLLGPNTIGGAINVLTLEPTQRTQSFIRMFGGTYGTLGETLQSTGSAGRFGYALSLHGVTAAGSPNRVVDAPGPQGVGSHSGENSILGKLRYQLPSMHGFGYVQFDLRTQAVNRDLSSVLTSYAPDTGYETLSGTSQAAYQSNGGLDAQVPLGAQDVDGVPATMLAFSHLTTVARQSVDGPGLDTLPYLYNQRDRLSDDWLEIDHRFAKGLLSLKYDVGSEALATDYVQGQAVAQSLTRMGKPGDGAIGANPAPLALALAQTQRSLVLRYSADPTSHVHYSLAAYASDFSTFGTSFDPRAGFVWTPNGSTALRASVGTTFQTPQLSELVVPPSADRAPIGGVVYVGNPNLQPDHATEYDLGADRIFGRLRLSADLYETRLRATSSQLNVTPIPGCQTPANPAPCPVSMPINAGDGVYRGIDLRAERNFGKGFHLHAGWDVDSSYLTTIPPSIQDGTLVAGQQLLGQPLHKAFFEFDRDVAAGLRYGARLNYEGTYNELNRTPYATLDAHVAWRRDGFEIGLYGTNLTNAYADPFTLTGGGIAYGTQPGNPTIATDAYALQGAKVVLVLTRSF